MGETKAKEVTAAKRITRKICVINDMHWQDLLQHEKKICEPEDSWSFRSWIRFLLRLGLTEEQIFDIAQQRLKG